MAQEVVNRAQQVFDASPLATLLARIQAKYDPLAVWLFGSRARGDARPGSDWDLLVVVPDHVPDEECSPLAAWRLQRHSGVYADIITCRPDELREDWCTVNTIPYIVAHEGRLLYER